MLAVTDITKKIYTEHNVHKVLTISFPEDDIDDITNENIVSESMKLLGSICEESAPQVGGCNASQFEITLLDVEQDITNKKIKVTLSCKDPNYKGEWSEGTNYVEGDIVKIDSGYFEYIQDTEGKLSDNVVVNAFGVDSFALRDNVYIHAQTTDLDVLKSLTITFTESALIGAFKVRVRAWYTGYAYYVDTYVTKSPTSVVVAKTYDGYPLAGWNIAIYDNTGQTDETTLKRLERLANSIRVKKYDYIPIAECSPDEISDYASKIYGYIDTSETEDIVLFAGKIKSVKKQADRRLQDVTAYDKLHELQNTDVSEWFNENIADTNWKGNWVQDTLYEVGQIVQLYSEPTGYAGYYVFYRCKKQLTSTAATYSPMYLCAGLTMMTSPPLTEDEAKEFWERIGQGKGFNPKKYTNIKNIRDGLFSYLGIEQQEVTLPMDDIQLYIEPINCELKAADLLEQICNSNARYGRINPENEMFEYLSIEGVTADENYKGAFVSGTTNNSGDVVLINNEETEYFNKYYECIQSTSGLTQEKVENNLCTGWTNPSSGIKFLPPQSKGINLVALQFDFDDALAKENSVSIRIGKYITGEEVATISESGRCEIERGITFAITVGNVTDEFWDTFSMNFVYAAGESANLYEPTDELVEEFWKQKEILYHPSGRINLTQLYELDGVEYQDYVFENNHNFYIEDTDGNVVQGAKKSGAIPIRYDFLYMCMLSSMFYGWIQSHSEKFALSFVPTKLKCKGLPFLEVGDQVCFDVEELGEIKTINTVIMCRTLSGISALTDEIEAEYE